MNTQNGFTLVELIVTSAISLMIGGLILTVFLVNRDQIEEINRHSSDVPALRRRGGTDQTHGKELQIRGHYWGDL